MRPREEELRPILDYLVVRSHALKTRLLKPDFIMKLVKTKDLNEFTELLSKTEYQDRLKTLKEINAATLEGIFHAEFFDKISLVIAIAPLSIARFLHTRYFMKGEIQNLKRIFRAKVSKTPIERIKQVLMPIASFSIPNLDKFIETETVEDSIRLLKDTIYSSVAERIELYERYDSLWPIESMLESVYLEAVMKEIEDVPSKEFAKRMILVEGDFENLSLAVGWRSKAKQLPFPINVREVFQATYSISAEVLEKFILAERLSDALRLLEKPYRELIKPIVEGDEALARAKLRRYLYELTESEGLKEWVGLPYVISYITSCDIERGNLISIAWGKEHEVKPESILKYIVLLE